MQEKGAQITRDYLINAMDIRNVMISLGGLEWRYDPSQAQSLRHFTEHNSECVYHYQEMASDTGTAFEFAVGKRDT